MRKSKIVDDKPKWTMPPILRWKCPSCRTWVKEEINKCCVACKTGVSVTPTPDDVTPAKRKTPTTKKTPKMFSDLGDMFGH